MEAIPLPNIVVGDEETTHGQIRGTRHGRPNQDGHYYLQSV